MATKAAIKRLTKEAQLMDKDPPPLVYARPREDNILEWHYILRGPPDTPYAGGEYHGQLLFPPEFPFKPPGIKMQTPSGRFDTNTRICTSMSDYHPGTWQPGWNTSTILIGLLSFMCSDEITAGSVNCSAADRKKLAAQSHAFNITQKRFCQIFPEFAGPQMVDLPNMGDKKPAANGASSSTAAGASDKVGGSSNVSASPSSFTQPISNELRNRSTSNAGSKAASGTIPAVNATNPNNTNDNHAPPLNAARQDRFGLRSSVVLLAVLAYLFVNRLMNASNNGVI